MKGVFHIHTSYSFDCLITPRQVVRQARKLGLDFIVITDHETIKGALEAKKIGGLRVIVGAEYKTEKGEVMGLFLKQEVNSRKSCEVIREIKAQGGIVVLPHPYIGHELDQAFIEAVDVIEIYNSRARKGHNVKALRLAKQYKKPGIVSSDAHFIREMGLTVTSFDENSDLKEAILSGQGKIVRAMPNLLPYTMLTGVIKLCRTKDLRVILGWGKKLLKVKEYLRSSQYKPG